MDQILRFLAIILVTVKRMAAQRTLVLASLLGIVAAAAISMSIPLYSDAAYQKIYSTTFTESNIPGSLEGSHPPYALMYRYVGVWSGPVSMKDLEAVDSYLSSGSVPVEIGLPSTLFVRYLQTDTFHLFPAGAQDFQNNLDAFEFVNFGALGSLEEHIDLVSGRMPASQAPASAGPETPVEVLVSDSLASRVGLKAGELYTAYTEVKTDAGTRPVQLPVRVTGTWKARNAQDPYWFYGVSGIDKVLITPEAALISQVFPYAEKPLSMAVWYWVVDGTRIHSNQVPDLLNRIDGTRKFAQLMLPDTNLDLSPEDILQRFQRSAQSLTLYLVAFIAPLLGMILIFIGLVAEMVVARRRNEIAVMRSRGASILQVTSMAVLEGLLLGLVGLACAVPLAPLVASFFTRAVSFLNFSGASPLAIDFTPDALGYGILAALVGAAAQVLPTLGAARHTVITYKQERARPVKPLWQRLYLDLVLLVPAAYGFFTMQLQGGLTLPGQSSALVNDPFQNPLLLLVPALGIFAAALVLIRFLPRLMGLVASLAGRTSSVGGLMAARYLARASGGYNAPLILLVVTLSLSTFTASLAQTLDRHINDQTFYTVGSDLMVVEEGEFTGPKVIPYAPVPQQTPDASVELGTKWVFLPVSDHLKVPGVTGAARIGRFGLNVNAPRARVNASFIGVDWYDFTKVAYWRSDFASQPLGGLMNSLALAEDNVLVNADFAAQQGLKVGDALRVSGAELGQTYAMQFKVAGTFKLFPTWYPAGGPLIVGNLDYFFAQAGTNLPYTVWLKTAPGADPIQVLRDVSSLYGRILDSSAAAIDLATEMSRPERQGFFGLLTVGFIALAFLTVLGFLLYALFSFRQRFIELGMLRAIGLSTRQMLTFLTAELAFLFSIGLGAGTGLGVWVSSLFIPQLQVGNRLAARIPPFLVRIDWPAVFQIYYLFVILFLVALVTLGVMLARMKIFQAVKLGEAV